MKRKQSLFQIDENRTPLYRLIANLKETENDFQDEQKQYTEIKNSLLDGLRTYSEDCPLLINKAQIAVEDLRRIQKQYTNGKLIQRHRLEEHLSSDKIQGLNTVTNMLELQQTFDYDKKFYKRLSRGLILKDLKSDNIYVYSGIKSLPAQALTQIGFDSVGIACLTLVPYLAHTFPERAGEEISFGGKLAMGGIMVLSSAVMFFMSHFVPNELFRSKNLFGKLANDIEERTKYVAKNLDKIKQNHKL